MERWSAHAVACTSGVLTSADRRVQRLHQLSIEGYLKAAFTYILSGAHPPTNPPLQSTHANPRNPHSKATTACEPRPRCGHPSPAPIDHQHVSTASNQPPAPT